jgi:hypothetical protein
MTSALLQQLYHRHPAKHISEIFAQKIAQLECQQSEAVPIRC